MFVDGARVLVRVTLDQLSNPPRFAWNYRAFAWSGAGEHVAKAKVFIPQQSMGRETTPARVVIEPVVLFRDGVTSAAPVIHVWDRAGAPLGLEGRAVKLFSYRDLVKVGPGQILAMPDRAGLAKVTALVDGVLSCNVARVMVGSVEIVPGAMHLEPSTDPVGKVSLRVTDALGKQIPLRGHQVSFTNDSENVAVLSSDGTVRALATGAGKQTCIRGKFGGTSATNNCTVRVLRYPVSLLPEREVRGRYISFWYPPVAMSPVPIGSRFEEMVRQYDFVGTLDQEYLRMWELTGTVPGGAWRQHIKALCEDDVFKLCGAAGGDVGLGFDPLSKHGSCVQIASDSADAGVPHWGVVSHEIGHCFVGEFASLNRILGDQRLSSGPAFVEGLATFCNIYARRLISSRPEHYGVAPAAVYSFDDPAIYDSLPFHWRIFVDERLVPWARSGARYPDGFTADVLAGMFMVLGQKYGWAIYPRFFSVFWPPDEPVGFSPRNETERATFFIAAMNAAARTDLRSDFRGWGLPCDDAFYKQLLPELTWRAAQRD
jgi:hypothetical protein